MRTALRIARIAARSAPAAPRPALRVAAVGVPIQSAPVGLSSVRGFSTTFPTLKKGGKKEAKKADNKKADKGGKKKKGEEEEAEAKLTDAEIDDIVEKARAKMVKSADWAKSVMFEGVERGRGRVSPSVLDTVKVAIPDQGSQPLKAVAAITVTKGGLLVEAWDSTTVKHVESALHKANLPGMSPQRDGDRIRLPVAKPDATVRTEIARSLTSTVEDAKNQMRQARTDGIKALGGKNEPGADEVQSALEANSHEIDKQLQTAKKELEKA